MRFRYLIVAAVIVAIIGCADSDSGDSLSREPGLPVARNVDVTVSQSDGVELVTVTMSEGAEGTDQDTIAWFPDIAFQDGQIDFEVRSRLRDDAPPFARGFAGIAFRISPEAEEFESFYLRPANGRAEDPERRSHATQYFSFPEYPFSVLRSEYPGVYESAVDIGLDEWIKVRVEVEATTGRLFVNDMRTPVLVVDDMKHGADASGGIGFWVDTGTVADFRNLSFETRD